MPKLFRQLTEKAVEILGDVDFDLMVGRRSKDKRATLRMGGHFIFHGAHGSLVTELDELPYHAGHEVTTSQPNRAQRRAAKKRSKR